MEAHAALVRADGAAVLHSPGAVHLRASLVVDPGDAELDHALGLDQALQPRLLGIVRMRLNERPDAEQHLVHRLQELGLVRVALAYGGEKILDAGRSQFRVPPS